MENSIDIEKPDILTLKESKERKRIIRIIKRKIATVIKFRKENIKCKQRLPSIFRQLRSDIIFLINNPDYVRIKDRE